MHDLTHVEKRTAAFVEVKDRMRVARAFGEGCGGVGMGSG